MAYNSRTNKYPLHILIVEAYTDANIGSCALVENTLKILTTKFPKSEIKVVAQYPKAFSDNYNISAVHDIFIYPAKQPLFNKILWLIKTVAETAPFDANLSEDELENIRKKHEKHPDPWIQYQCG